MGADLERFIRAKALIALQELADRWFPALSAQRRDEIAHAALQSLWRSASLGRSEPIDVAAVLRQHGLQALRNDPSQEPGLPGWVPVPPTRQAGDVKVTRRREPATNGANGAGWPTQ